MAASAGAWYRVGKVNVTNNNQSVVGVDTNWQSDVIAIAIGDIFTLDAKTWYEVIAVNSDTSITLDRGFEGSTGTNKTYAIVRNTSGTILTRIAGQVSVQFNQKQLFLDELRTWLNSDNASEELTDSHGLKQSLKTPSQMVRDHDNKLAELDAINPYPYAMRKAEFEARRNATSDRFAAAGFLSMGINWSSSYEEVNKGLGIRISPHSSWSNTFSLGSNEEPGPVINIAGILTRLKNLPRFDSYVGENAAFIRLPPEEDGTRTYDSNNGQSVLHATPEIAFASETSTNKVVTDRVDMWGFEGFLREIKLESPFVYANGLIQSKPSTINGVTAETDVIRDITYFSMYKGDTSIRGNGINWFNASEGERAAFASDPNNNLYFDDRDGKFYQWCVRIRSFAGNGNGNWKTLDSTDSQGGYGAIRFDTESRIQAQGNLDDNVVFSGDTVNQYRLPDYALNPSKHFGLGHTTHVSGAIDNSIYFLVCGTVNRLNKGAYHPSLNPKGSAGWRFLPSDLTQISNWANLPASYTVTRQSCFYFKSSNGGEIGAADYGGNISQGQSGRFDGRYSDMVYSGGQGGICRDARYPALPLSESDFSSVDLKIKSGAYFGRDYLKRVYLDKGVRTAASSAYIYLDAIEGRNYPYGTPVGFRITDTGNSSSPLTVNEWYSGKVSKLVNGRLLLFIEGIGTAIVSSGTASDLLFDILGVNESLETVSGEYTTLDVMGSVEDIARCPALSSGWVGNWVDGDPNGSAPKLNEKSVESSLYYQQTSNLGASWTSGTRAINKTTNEVSIEPSSGTITLLYYKVLAGPCLPTSNSVVKDGCIGIGTVCFSDTSDERAGSNLGFSLTGNIMTSTTSANKAVEVSLLKTTIFPSTGLLDANNLSAHQPCPLLEPTNNSTAFKALNYATEESGQGFINYAYTELKHDGTDWGDDSKIHIADNQTTMLDTNGNTVKVGTARIVEPLGWVKDDK